MKRRKQMEAEFCEKTLRPLLEAMSPFISNLRYRHGNTEFGKDFTFSYINPLSQRMNVGLQAKWGDIKGSSTSLISQIVDQSKVAFKVPYKNKPDGQELYLNELYIVCSGKYKTNAIEIIEKALEKNYNVHFLDGADIADLRQKVVTRRTREKVETKRALNALLIELDQNIKTAKMIDSLTEESMQKEEHFLIRYRLNCLETVLGSDIDDKRIIDEGIKLWYNLTMQNSILEEIPLVSSKESKENLRNRSKKAVGYVGWFRGYVASYLDTLA